MSDDLFLSMLPAGSTITRKQVIIPTLATTKRILLYQYDTTMKQVLLLLLRLVALLRRGSSLSNEAINSGE